MKYSVSDTILLGLFRSWSDKEGQIHSTEEIISWIQELNETTFVSVNECSINNNSFWFYDDYRGEVLNRKRSFFSITGVRMFVNDLYIREQPIIIQPEIGYLGIICKYINGTLHFLMQAKIEPGNVNCVQISPTIQATKSNFTRAHGGKMPLYFEYFEHANRHTIIYDQIQSEQASRFYHKRNRNMLLLVEDEVTVYPGFTWMTLGQLKELMRYDNLVNMDTRTVISGVPLVTVDMKREQIAGISELFKDVGLYNSLYTVNSAMELSTVFNAINNYKMFKDTTVAFTPLNQLVDWVVDDYGIVCKSKADFMVRYYDIEIAGREVRKWMQPLFKALGSATFGLITTMKNGTRLFLIRIKPEIGSFDKVEIGPTIQWESTHEYNNEDAVEKLFRSKIKNKSGIIVEVVLSEEGGRFYHEQNLNVIMEIGQNELEYVPDQYVWTSFATLNLLLQTNNCLNIQLRNLLSLIEI